MRPRPRLQLAMWMLFLNGGWQPAESDAVVVAWIQQGWVNAQTPIQHASWSQPMQLAHVAAFAPHLAPVQDEKPGLVWRLWTRAMGLQQDATTGRSWLAAATLFALLLGLLVWRAMTHGATVVSIARGVSMMLLSCAGLGLAAGARWWPQAPPRAKLALGALTARPLMALVILLGPLLSAGAGFRGGLAERAVMAAAVDACSQAVLAAGAVQGSKPEELPYEQSMGALMAWKRDSEQGARLCEDAEDPARAASLRAVAQVAQRQMDARKKRHEDELEKARQAQAEVERKRRIEEAIATFPAREKHMRESLKLAASAQASRQWESAELHLFDVDSVLKKLSDTPVAFEPAYAAVQAKMLAQRAAIAPHLDKIRKEKERQAAKAEADAKLRGPAPTLSAWDGSCSVVERWLKRNLNDPKSYEHISTSQPVALGSTWVVVTRFRASNAFGAKIVDAKTVMIRQGEVVEVLDL